ncbi:uncharacterized protein LOC129756583 isoform X2 [Uranotaenia lowii]|uniref:uncharacterized protein LOC129756582 isoform X2 n=1 Tax=Uranotaenia lowii TaxID=190385 RepID=UPI002479F95E|nr:uncharacterized protein LOC129756582 isoform X2 [Uranotaenia lowii]XP_055609468.1 uncharacterized protein LOC129756583 isoform X2 [Uranotaenia lowii]
MSGKRHCSFRTIVKCGARNRTHQNSARRAKSLLKVTDPDSAENGYSQAQATKARTTNPRHVPRSQTRPDQRQQHQVGRNEATRKVNSKRVAQSGPFLVPAYFAPHLGTCSCCCAPIGIGSNLFSFRHKTSSELFRNCTAHTAPSVFSTTY